MKLAYGNVTLGILAGGQGSRMQNLDKGLVSYQNQPLSQHVINTVTEAAEFTEILISANRNIEQYQQIAAVVIDRRTGYEGPLAGIESLLTSVKTDWLLLCSCDTLNPPVNLASMFLLAVKPVGVKLAIAEDSERLHYTCSMIHRDLLPSISAYLDDGHRSIKGWLASLPANNWVTTKITGELKNANTLQDLQEQ